MPSVSKGLMTTGPIWAKELGPIVEHVALTLFDAKSQRFGSGRKSRRGTLPTLLTEANRSGGRNVAKKETRSLRSAISHPESPAELEVDSKTHPVYETQDRDQLCLRGASSVR